MTVTTVRSAFPREVAELLPRARELVAELGAIPSRNRLKAELRVGAPKANAVRDALLARDPRTPDQPTPIPAPPMMPAVPEMPPAPVAEPATAAALLAEPAALDQAPTIAAGASPAAAVARRKPLSAWPVLLLALPAFVAIWSGWVGLGEMTGFGVVHPLPGIADRVSLNTAITLPIGVETYAAFALRVWLSGRVARKARRFAMWSAIGSLAFGALGQMAYHLMAATNITHAPWQITTLVASLPVAVLGMGAALAHLITAPQDDQQ